MKKIIFNLSILFIIIVTMNGCLDYYITSHVYPNGKIERFFKVRGDYDMIHTSSSMKLPSDSTWKIKTWWELDDSTKSKPDSVYVYSASKVFKNYKKLNLELAIDSTIYNQVKTKVLLKRKFRWFYTFLEYKEIFEAYFPFHQIPADNFATPEEIKYTLSDEDDYRFNPVKNIFEPLPIADTTLVLTKNDSIRAKKLKEDIENRVGEWQARNIYNEFYLNISQILRKKDKYAFNKLMHNKEALYDSLDIKNVLDFDDDSDKIVSMIDTLISKTSRLLGISGKLIQPSENFEMQGFLNKMYYQTINIWYQYHIKTVMPGEILKTNSIELEEGNSTWNIAMKDFYVNDFDMTVESRIVNKWAIVLSILISIILIGTLVYGIGKRKK